MEKIIRVGLVGYGMSGRVFHAPFLHTLPQYELTAVVERNRNEAEQTYPYVSTERSIDALLKRDDIDLIVITTPNETHYPYTMLALEAGKDVVLEKPFANNTQEAAKLVSLGEASDNILSVYQNRRYVGDFKTIQQIIKQGSLGKVHEYICHFDRYRTEPRPGNAWREKNIPGSGILFDLGPHVIDQALCLFGLPKTITAFVKNQRSFSEVDDYFELRLDFGDDCIAILKSGMLVKEMGPRYAVHGTQGSYLKYGDDPQEALLKQWHLPVGDFWGVEEISYHGLLHTTINHKDVRQFIPTLPGNYGTYYTNLYDSIINRKKPQESPAHGFNTIKLVELAFESSKLGKSLACEGLMDVPYPGR